MPDPKDDAIDAEREDEDKEEKEMTDEEKKKKKESKTNLRDIADKELQKARNELIEAKQNTLIELGYPKKMAHSIKDKNILNFKIMELRETKNAKEGQAVDNVPKVNAGNDQIILPSGETLDADPTLIESRFDDLPFLNQFGLPNEVVLFDSDARLNMLPPDEEHPYGQLVG